MADLSGFVGARDTADPSGLIGNAMVDLTGLAGYAHRLDKRQNIFPRDLGLKNVRRGYQ